MLTVWQALRRPWKLPVWWPLSCLALSLGTAFISINPELGRSDSGMYRALAMALGLALVIQFPILVALSAQFLRLKSHIGVTRFSLVFVLLVAIGLACGSFGHEHEAIVTLFCGSVCLLVLVPLTNWLFGARAGQAIASSETTETMLAPTHEVKRPSAIALATPVIVLVALVGLIVVYLNRSQPPTMNLLEAATIPGVSSGESFDRFKRAGGLANDFYWHHLRVRQVDTQYRQQVLYELDLDVDLFGLDGSAASFDRVREALGSICGSWHSGPARIAPDDYFSNGPPASCSYINNNTGFVHINVIYGPR